MEKATTRQKVAGMRDLSMTTEGAISRREIGPCNVNKTGSFSSQTAAVQLAPKCLAWMQLGLGTLPSCRRRLDRRRWSPVSPRPRRLDRLITEDRADIRVGNKMDLHL